MRHFWLLLAACAVCAGADPDFHARRTALAKALPEGVAVVYGHTDSGEENLRGYFQDADFYYLTGWSGPGAALLLDPAREILFIPRHNRQRERWTGPQPAQDDPNIKELTGFDTVMAPDELDAELRASLERYPKVAKADLDRAMARLRMVKSAEEIRLLQRTADATVAAHLAAWKRAAPGVYEYQVAATMVGAFLDRGCERSAYAPIVGSGPNSVFLHYAKNSRRMEAGDLLLMDVGAECAGYAGDVTRTIPVGGKFSARQREIYAIVLGAQNAIIAAIKPGAYLSGRNRPSLQQVAFDYINSHGKDLRGEPLGKYLAHGVSHHIGLDVHDAADNSLPLDEGMVISVEPGVYIPEENIGIRIEDMALVTKNGARLLTAALPRDAAEIEKAVRK